MESVTFILYIYSSARAYLLWYSYVDCYDIQIKVAYSSRSCYNFQNNNLWAYGCLVVLWMFSLDVYMYKQIANISLRQNTYIQAIHPIMHFIVFAYTSILCVWLSLPLYFLYNLILKIDFRMKFNVFVSIRRRSSVLAQYLNLGGSSVCLTII